MQRYLLVGMVSFAFVVVFLAEWECCPDNSRAGSAGEASVAEKTEVAQCLSFGPLWILGCCCCCKIVRSCCLKTIAPLKSATWSQKASWHPRCAALQKMTGIGLVRVLPAMHNYQCSKKEKFATQKIYFTGIHSLKPGRNPTTFHAIIRCTIFSLLLCKLVA